MLDITDRTAKALGDNVMESLRSLRFCVVGWGHGCQLRRDAGKNRSYPSDAHRWWNC